MAASRVRQPLDPLEVAYQAGVPLAAATAQEHEQEVEQVLHRGRVEQRLNGGRASWADTRSA